MREQAEFIKITPTKAAKWLEMASNGNRNIRQTRVDAFARDMAAGQWAKNGEPIIFDTNGVLLDGQHRLAACKQSKTPFPSLVVTSVRPDCFDTFDSGISRTAADALRAKGIPDANNVAAVARVLWKIEKYENFWKGNPVYPTPRELEEFLDSDLKAIQKSSRVGRSMGRMLPTSVAGPLHYLFNQIDPDDADYFFARLNDGADLKSKSAILLLRKRLIENQTGPTRLPRRHLAALTIKAWNTFRNRFRSRKRMGTLRWDSKRENFPEIS